MSQEQKNSNLVEITEDSKKKTITQEELATLKEDPNVRIRETPEGLKKLNRMNG